MPGTRHELDDLFAAADLQRPEDAIGYLLWRVAHRHQREMDRALADLDLTHLQFVALVQTAWLSRADSVVMQSGLAGFSSIHPMQLSSVLKALAAKNLIVRPRSLTDTRTKEIALTPAGVAVLAKALPRATAHQQRFFEASQGNGSALHAALRQIVATWDDEG